jgi:hypothetical protein
VRVSRSELKRLVDGASAEERLLLEHYLAQRRRQEDPQYAEELARRHQEMDAGHKLSWKQLKRLHQQMLDQGL